jgi:lipopolysaccharide biosynthesis glycosyltransferase
MLSSLKNCLPEKSRVGVYVCCTEEVEPLANNYLGVLRDHRFSIDLVTVDSQLSKFDDWFRRIFTKKERRSFNQLAGTKLLAYKLLPKNIAKVIWLDSDLVIRADISDLWNILPCDSVVAAVQDENIPSAEKRWGAQAGVLGIHASEKYFNSGVLVLDLLKYSRYINADRIDELLNSFSPQIKSGLFRYYDQDFLNCLLPGKIYPVNPLWNRTKRESIGRKDLLMHGNMISNGPCIQHYPHLDKPWSWRTSTVESVYFYEAAQKAPWPNKYTRTRWSMVALFALARSPLRKFYRFIKNRYLRNKSDCMLAPGCKD